MVPPNHSIQHFYQKTTSTSQTPGHNAQGENAAFTPAEIEAARRPATETWKPKGTYETVNINQLQLGNSRKFRFQGRIVNFCHARDGSRRGNTLPQDFHFLIVKDNTGVVAVRLLATNTDYECVELGKLVTIWAAAVLEYQANAPIRAPRVSMLVPVFPTQQSPSCIKFRRERPGSDDLSLCRLPLDYNPNNPSLQIPGLMNLKAYLNSGHEGVPEAKVLVCVSSIGPRKVFRSSKSRSREGEEMNLEVVDVKVFDETTSCLLTLWNDKVASARTWTPNQTLLLISNPTYCPGDKKNVSPGLGISVTSMIEVDPVFPDADWLSQMASNRTKRDGVYIPFPHALWDIHEIRNTSLRPLLTIAEVDELVRSDPRRVFTGKISLLILVVRIVENRRTMKLCCSECCGVPLYANRPVTVCKNCNTERNLALNPRIIGPLIDETGSVAAGKLIWSDKAWTELFFGKGTYHVPADGISSEEPRDVLACSWQELVTLELEELRSVEDQLQYSRVTLTFGWSSDVGRLCILGVDW
ncbi:hypothetical protein QBC47DRAFT_219783 [Echria macrotheca]|uniref:Uncharacterized protein n=1 Tax=Echria macrotheca TaxID=438768 RepID=A0AAJ0BCH2_9PEZI|nr:hypothetical protein QBC47DRAFT_219783 [Echria macrotheca]